MSRIGTIDIIQNSQDINNNTTSITVQCIITTTGESYRGDHRTGTVTIKQGTTTIHTANFTHGAPANTRTILYSVTLTVNHNSDGSSAAITANYNYDSGWATGTATKALTTIARKSTLSVGNGTLDVEQTLTVSKKASSYTHTITATCSGSTETICTKSSSTSVKFKPPKDWASKNTKGTSLTVTYTITTYNGNTSIGSNSYNKTCTIPDADWVKPTVTTEVAEASDLQWGVYTQGKSQLRITSTATPQYGTTIASYKTTVDGDTYKSSSFTTPALKNSGELTITTTVTDERGRTGTHTQTITVQAYKSPIITTLKVKRCEDTSGKEDLVNGKYCQVTVAGDFSALYDMYGESNNTASFRVEYKKTDESEYTTAGYIGYGGVLESGNTGELSKVFPANEDDDFRFDTGSSYHIKVTAIDAFGEAPVITSLSTGFAIMHFLASGFGMGLGKVAELEGLLDIGFQTRHMGGLLQPELENETDFDTVMIPNTYTVKAAKDSGYLNCPISSNTTGTLLVEACGDQGQIRQTFKTCSKAAPTKYERYYYQESWSDWVNATADYVIEVGTSDIWTYRKWNSGVAECWGCATYDSAFTSNTEWLGGLAYFTTANSTSFPSGLFKESPVCNVQYQGALKDGNYYASFPYQSDGPATATRTTPIRVMRIGGEVTGVKLTVDYYAIGKWK